MGSPVWSFEKPILPPGYLQSLWIRWHQLQQLSTQGVQAYIDYFSKIHLLLHIPDPEEVLILMFFVGLLIQFHREVELFENTSLDKVFQRSLAIERNIAPKGHTPQSRPNPTTSIYQPSSSNPSPRFSNPRPQNTNSNTTWCSFHKTTSHSTADCRVLKSIKTNKTLFTEPTAAEHVEDNEEVWSPVSRESKTTGGCNQGIYALAAWIPSRGALSGLLNHMNRSKRRGFWVPRWTKCSQWIDTTSDTTPEWRERSRMHPLKEGATLHPGGATLARNSVQVVHPSV